ncbi:MAG TPA: vWA domain-containing protein, partial [Chthoniobacterales bacterium]
MTDWIFRIFSSGEKLPEGSQEWSWGAEGIPLGWAFFLFLVLAAACAWAYRRFAPGAPPRWRRLLAALRIAVIAIFLILLVKPALNLTLHEPVRQALLVLVDASESMQIQDRRTAPEDLKRAGLATGALDPRLGLNQDAPAGAAAASLNGMSRQQLLNNLAANEKLNLWPRLFEKSDLSFFRFGRDAMSAGPLAPEDSGSTLTTAEAARFFKALQFKEPATAIGEATRQVLGESRSQNAGAILLITDGANNSGLPPAEAARMARERDMPLFIYGIGVTESADLHLRDLEAPKLAFAKERVEVKAKLRSQGVTDRSVTATLKANGTEVASQKVEINENGDHEITFQFVPEEPGELTLEASTPVLGEEITQENNTASTKIRIVNDKVHVLYIDQEPRWDFRYLLAFLQRDRRLEVQAVLIDGEPGLNQLKDSPFLPGLPEDREGFFKNEILILGDVDPKDLGETRMQIIREWVEQASGGIIFLAGPKFDPSAYAGTPLEPLLPVVPDTTRSAAQRAERAPEPQSLKLTAAGETSPYLRLNEDPAENQKLWASFPGVRWTAPVERAKPGAQVLLEDPRPDRAGRDGLRPVMAIQGYGSGESVFIGTDETYRWR